MDQSRPAAVIVNNSLENWKVIGAGGYGQVHKARHVVWGFDVAIKLLQCDEGSSLHNEAEMMHRSRSPHVIRILGVYKDCPPNCGPSTQLGLVMEFMEKGTLESLLDTLSLHPPWPHPLACRLAHQIALGMNFLHCLKSPLLHQDLKPNNVLLDNYLDAKLADFGLAKVSHSVSTTSKEFPGKAGGTSSYMPPEALENVSYKPIRAFDIYSYGILLWSIITGQSKPYPDRGQRPSLEAVDKVQFEGLGDLVELMKKCWDHEPSKRPPFKECVLVTGRVFEKHQKGIQNVVNQVLLKLNLGSEEGSKTSGVGTPSVSPSSKPPACPKDKVNISADVKTGSLPPTQDVADGLSSKPIDKGAQFVDDNMEQLVQRISLVMPIADGLYQKKMIHYEDYSEITAAQTSMAKMRKLYVALQPGGSVAKSAFYQILLKQQYLLVKELGGVVQK
ncbi:receptor-interacting serine/threonine-protein kinase 3 isoform X2 [Oncorhynchus kisutch]|uniref:receptor-interacting serine/threonine-protein kinase 3 isoform X2 n=1 Tax=Oncorhynchus kisutch TaxID=8019 RepID=UPI0009A043F4|nr:receptor-interacting serine/threonine-protein kinase 3 isoform X2 [Oncorhynchus kisutch]XP_031678681.1 receptor-interacting serine/threonine-protein kinase 3 isoform X2 [Oncorhynchus kisutch]XP_031678682.1 receptor-interacting serine/threonine-protein kinase 3 isoform X2 [Oncorhynchus kisutch]